MWGVGPATKARLADAGIAHHRPAGADSPGSLQRLLGRAAGDKLTALAWNRDPREIDTDRRAHSAGAQSALGRKPATRAVFRPVLQHLADRIASRLRAKIARQPHRDRARPLRRPQRGHPRASPCRRRSRRPRRCAEVAVDLVRGVLADHRDERTISLLAISASHLGAAASAARAAACARRRRPPPRHARRAPRADAPIAPWTRSAAASAGRRSATAPSSATDPRVPDAFRSWPRKT